MSPEEVIRAVVERESRRERLSESAVAETDPDLVAAARRHFGTWESALVYAGVGPRYVSREDEFGRDALVRRIRRMILGGRNITSQHVRRVARPLHDAALETFGNWNAALEAAGLDHSGVDRYRSEPRPDNERILELLRERAKAGRSVRWSDVCLDDHAFALLAKRRFGSWGRVLAAAGLGTLPGFEPEQSGE